MDKYKEAENIFISIGDYKDSKELCLKAHILVTDFGDIIIFGNYNGNSGGSVYNYGVDVYFEYGAVRPALWIDISNL